MKFLPFVFGLALCGACASQGEAYKLYKFTPTTDSSLQTEELRFGIESLQSAVGATNYIVKLTVENIGDDPVEFSGVMLELVNAETGITHPFLEPDPLLASGFGMLKDQTIKPGRKIQGTVYFQTARGEATGKKLTLHLGGQQIAFSNAGFLTDDELKAQNAFQD